MELLKYRKKLIIHDAMNYYWTQFYAANMESTSTEQVAAFVHMKRKRGALYIRWKPSKASRCRTYAFVRSLLRLYSELGRSRLTAQ